MSDYFTGNYPLNVKEQETNALWIAAYLRAPLNGMEPWTFEAIAGLLGNTQSESRHNPGAWQGYTVDPDNPEWGYGLTQWTPSAKYRDWCVETGRQPDRMESAMDRLKYELDNGLQYYATTNYPLSFYWFTQSVLPTRGPAYLARAWLYNYERPEKPDPEIRGAQAEYWYTFITGNPLPKIRRKSKWIYYQRKKVLI